MNMHVAPWILVATLAAFAPQAADAQASTDRETVLRAAAEALGMLRYSDIGARTTRLPPIDVINTMEFEASGTIDDGGRAVPIRYHVALGYNPAAMRVTLTRDGDAEPTIRTVREPYAWNESEVGAGLVPGQGTATPALADLRERLLELWTLPYGVVKAALAAGDRTTVGRERGATVIMFPLSGALTGVTAKATLDANNRIARVETQADDAALGSLVTQTEFADYADHGEVLTDIVSPGHITRRRGGRTVLDIEVDVWEANNLYLVFPVPPSVSAAATAAFR
jgi:hypothetical protein